MRQKVAFLLDGFGNRRHYLQILALKEAGFEPKIITFEQAKEGYILAKGDLDRELFILMPFLRKKIMRRFSITFALALLNLLRRENIQIVLTHRYKLLRYLWFCKLFLPKLKIIFHMVISQAIKGWHQKFWFRRFKRYTDKILVNSKALKAELMSENLAKEEEIEVFYSGVAIEEFEGQLNTKEARRSLGWDENAFIFGMVAQFRKEKDQRGVIQAFKILKEKGYKAKLVLVGEGPYYHECEQLVEALNLKGEVIFTGRRSPTEIPLILRALDAYVYATFREGMPFAVLEAMASGLPIVATEAEGIPDLFESDKKFGFLVPKGNVEALAKAMEELLCMPVEERMNMGRWAKERIREAFSAEVLKRETIRLFQELSAK